MTTLNIICICLGVVPGFAAGMIIGINIAAHRSGSHDCNLPCRDAHGRFAKKVDK